MINWLASHLPDETSSLSTLRFFVGLVGVLSSGIFLVATGFLLAKYLDGNVVAVLITGFVTSSCALLYFASQARESAIKAAARLERSNRGY